MCKLHGVICCMLGEQKIIRRMMVLGNKKKDSSFLEQPGRPVHIVSVCAGSEEGSDHFGPYVYNLILYFCKVLFSELETMTL
jgi:hypothetical protein